MNFRSNFEDFLIKSENCPNFFPRRLEKFSIRWKFLKKSTIAGDLLANEVPHPI